MFSLKTQINKQNNHIKDITENTIRVSELLLRSTFHQLPARVLGCTDTRQKNQIIFYLLYCCTVNNFNCCLPPWPNQNTSRQSHTWRRLEKLSQTNSLWKIYLFCRICILKLYYLQILLVSGGYDYNDERLDSTEIFDPTLESWRAGAALPRTMWGPKAANIDNRVLLFGINILLVFYMSYVMAIIAM